MMFLHSIKFKFTLWYLSILGTMILLLGSGVYMTLSNHLHENLDNSLRIRAEQIFQFREIIPIIAGGTFEEEPGERVSFFYYANERLSEISQKRHAIPADTPWIEQILQGKTAFTNLTVSLDNEKQQRLRIYGMPYIPDDARVRLDIFRDGGRPENRPPPPPPRRSPRKEGERRPKERRISEPNIIKIEKAALIVARSSDNIYMVLDELLHILLAAIPLTLILVGGGGIVLLQRILKPVEKIVRTAREIEAKDLSKRIEVTSKDELGRLASTLNRMIERLQKAFIRQKELTGDASHELRTPLAVIQAEATLALQKDRDTISDRKALEIIAQESDYMSYIIQQLLTLARADSGKKAVDFQRVNLTVFLKELCEDVDILCREKGQSLHQEYFNDLSVRGNPKELRSLMLNLLGNAIRYTPKNGQISVTLIREKGKAVISVSDNGIGIPAQALPRIFERFYRVDKARSRETGGSGLGLAICRNIVELHGGKIVAKSQINRGSSFHVHLPTG